MSQSIDIYLTYCAMKAHFSKGDYDFVKFNGQSLDVSFVNSKRFILCKKLIKRRRVVFVRNAKCPFMQSVYSVA